jgi:light-harvesting complex I chlorophyll a/b binding protein 1
MSEYVNLGQEQTHRGGGKALLVLPLLVGFLLGVFFSPVLLTQSEVEVPAINMRGAFSATKSMSCPRQAPVSVPAMQQRLRKLGLRQDPMEKFALTSFAATRDVSMKAQAMDEFSKLDDATKAQVKKLSNAVVVRASKSKKKGGSDFDDLPGVTNPLGFWDPLGFTQSGEIAAYRRAELKHGRVCMVASLGLLVSEKFHPIFDAWDDGPWVSAVASHFSETAFRNFWPAFWIMAAGHELATTFSDYEGKEVFDYGFDPLGLKPDDAEKLYELQTKELNNGRLAMIGAAGIIAQELATGKPIY